MKRHVVLNAMCGPYKGQYFDGVTEIWLVNRAYTVEPRADRVYFFDPEHLFADNFLSELAALNVPVYTRRKISEVPLSHEFPRDAVTRYFKKTYSTSTVAWMIQHAIYEHCTGKPIDKLTLSSMYHTRDSMEYLWALPCINFWVGVAMGCGMNVDLHGDIAISRALPWETSDYGYRRNLNGKLCINTLSAAYEACYQYPRRFETADGERVATEDLVGLTETKRQLVAMLQSVDKQLQEIQPVESVA